MRSHCTFPFVAVIWKNLEGRFLTLCGSSSFPPSTPHKSSSCSVPVSSLNSEPPGPEACDVLPMSPGPPAACTSVWPSSCIRAAKPTSRSGVWSAGGLAVPCPGAHPPSQQPCLPGAKEQHPGPRLGNEKQGHRQVGPAPHVAGVSVRTAPTSGLWTPAWAGHVEMWHTHSWQKEVIHVPVESPPAVPAPVCVHATCKAFSQ